PTWSNLPLRAGPIPAASVPATTISRSSRLSNRGTGPGTVGRDHTGRDRHTDGSGHPLLPRSARRYGRSFRCALAAVLESGAGVSVIVRLDAKVKTAISSIPKDAWTTIEYTDAVNDEQTSRFSRSMSHPRLGRCLHGVTTYHPVDTATDTGGDMERTTRIPPAEITGVKGALIKRMIEKKLGKVPTAVGVYWHNP